MIAQQHLVTQLIAKQRVLIVQPMGWGKRRIYEQATKKLRAQNEGVTVVISPIQSTMADSAVIDRTTNQTFAERQQLIYACNTQRCQFLFISPEQLADDSLFALLSQLRIALLVIEEAHHLSRIGTTSDPHYRRIAQLLTILPENIRVLATTATANRRVTEDIAKHLGSPIIVKGSLSLTSLHLHKLLVPTTEQKYAWLKQNATHFTKPTLIYAASVRECERIADWLRLLGLRVGLYPKQTQAFMDNQLDVLLCTTATTTIFTKGDVQTVIHYDRPLSIVTYYQQISNAGRSIPRANCIILYKEKFAPLPKPSFKQAQYQEIITFIEGFDGVTLPTLKAAINYKDSVIQDSLTRAVMDGLLEKERNTYYRTPKPYILQQAYTRHVEQARQLEYNGLSYMLQTNGCLMQTTATTLDDTEARPCGKCSYCTQLSPTIDRIEPKDVQEVKQFFEARTTVFMPHKKSAMTNRPLRQRFTTGLALSYSDEPLGKAIYDEKFNDGIFSQATIDRVVQLLQPLCDSQTVIVPIPSTRHTTLVPTLAKQVAQALGVAYSMCFSKQKDTAVQSKCLNEAQQEQNIRHHLVLAPATDFSDQHVILLDDFVDSRWTFAVAADVLHTTAPRQITAVALVDQSTT